jgi:hypothetical protein
VIPVLFSRIDLIRHEIGPGELLFVPKSPMLFSRIDLIPALLQVRVFIGQVPNGFDVASGLGPADGPQSRISYHYRGSRAIRNHNVKELSLDFCALQ